MKIIPKKRQLLSHERKRDILSDINTSGAVFSEKRPISPSALSGETQNPMDGTFRLVCRTSPPLHCYLADRPLPVPGRPLEITLVCGRTARGENASAAGQKETLVKTKDISPEEDGRVAACESKGMLSEASRQTAALATRGTFTGGEGERVDMSTVSGASQENGKDWFGAMLGKLNMDSSLKAKRESCKDSSPRTRRGARKNRSILVGVLKWGLNTGVGQKVLIMNNQKCYPQLRKKRWN